MEEFLQCILPEPPTIMHKHLFDIVTGTYRHVHLYTPEELCIALTTRSPPTRWTHLMHISNGNSNISLCFVNDDTLAIRKHVPVVTIGTVYEVFFYTFSLPHKIHPEYHKHFPRLLSINDTGTDMVFEHIPITFHDMFRTTPSVSALMLRFRQLVSVLKELHSHGIYHRDLKPDNVRFHIDGTMVLMDYDSCIHSCHLNQQHTETPIGTVHYMAPELMSSSPTYDASKVDVYSTGMLLISMVNGGQPLVHGTMSFYRTDLPSPIETALGVLHPMCQRMLSYHALARPSMGEILTWLDSSL